MISMECLLTVLCGPRPWDKWLNTAPVKARGFLWACVSLCAFCWREGSSQLIDTELSMKRTKRSPLLLWLASSPKRGLPVSLRPQMKHTRAHTHTHTRSYWDEIRHLQIYKHGYICEKRTRMKLNIWADGPLFICTRSVIQHPRVRTHRHISKRQINAGCVYISKQYRPVLWQTAPWESNPSRLTVSFSVTPFILCSGGCDFSHRLLANGLPGVCLYFF